ncbi:MAG: DUF4258 domain-containing protein [Pirellulales bacterium]
MNIQSIQQAIAAGQVRVTDHAEEAMSADGLKLEDVLKSISSGEIIEDYPSDYPFPSCLMLGRSQ